MRPGNNRPNEGVESAERQRHTEQRHPGVVRVSPYPHTATEIADGLETLGVAEGLRGLVEELSTVESLTADPPISGYVGVRPNIHGDISAYVHKSVVSLALEPHRARAGAELTGASLQQKNPTTWFLRLTPDMVTAHHDVVLRLAGEAVHKSAAGPPYEGGKEAARLAKAARDICPLCHQYVLSVAGNCMCGYGDE